MPDKPLPAGIWLRVSTADQSEEAQLPDCQRYGEAKGYEIHSDCIYAVHGASARTGNRKFDNAWDQVLRDFRSGRIKVLIVWRLSRLDRKLRAMEMIREATEMGGRIEFAQQPHLNDLSTMGGRIALHVEEEIAFAESEEKSQRAKISLELRKSQGKNVHRFPWGLESKDLKLQPTQQGLKWLPFVFDQIIAGRAPGEVAAMLVTAGAMKQCHSLYIRRMVGNEKYRGLVIDPVTFDKANDKLKSAPRRGRGPSTGERSLFTPKCRECGGAMWVHVGTYYRCFSAQPGGSGKRGCGAKLVPIKFVLDIINDLMSDPEEPHKEWRYVPGDDTDRQVRELRDAGALAMRKGEYAKAMQIMQEAEHLESSPRKEAGWQEVESGISEAEWWEAATVDDKRAYLAEFTFTAGWENGHPVLTMEARKGH